MPGPKASEVPRGLEERKAYGVGAGRLLCPDQRGPDAGGRKGGGEVVGQLGREDLATPFEPAQQGGGDPLMQIYPTRWRQGCVAGLPIEVVDERGCTRLITGADQDAGCCTPRLASAAASVVS